MDNKKPPTRIMLFDKETASTFRYRADDKDGLAPICKMIYFEKWLTQGTTPKRLRITVDLPEDEEISGDRFPMTEEGAVEDAPPDPPH